MFASRMAILLPVQVGDRLCLTVLCESARDDGCKLKYRKYRLYVGKNLFNVSVTERWQRLPREIVECPSLEIFRRGLGIVLSNLL